MHWDSMTRIARTATYSREATRETSFHGLAPPHFPGAFELFGHASSRLLKKAVAGKEAGLSGSLGFAHAPTYADSSPSGLAYSACSWCRASSVRRLTAAGDLDAQLHGRATGACRTAVLVLHPHPSPSRSSPQRHLHRAARSAVQGAEGLPATDGCVGGLVVQSRRRAPRVRFAQHPGRAGSRARGRG